MSSPAIHQMLTSKLQAFPHVGALNMFNTEGWLINSSEMWPVSDIRSGTGAISVNSHRAGRRPI